MDPNNLTDWLALITGIPLIQRALAVLICLPFLIRTIDAILDLLHAYFHH